MTNRSLMNKTSHKRRQAIIMFIITILVLGVVSGMGGTFITDNTVYTASRGETIVMEQAPPETGSPSDYNALDNLQFAAYKLHHSAYFRGETDGVSVADLGFTTYSQRLRNTRIVLGEDKVFAETVSSSSLKNLGEQKYADGDIIIFRPSVSVKDGVAVFSDTAYPMTYETYADSYGTIPNQLSKHIINENTILAVKDENAPMVAGAKNAPRDADEDESDGFDFYVPERLTPGADGHYVFTLTLDPDTATRYYRNEMRTLAGADQNPKFYSVSVTVEIDGNWDPVKVTTVENYDIAIPVLGSMNCTGTNIETFYQLGDTSGTLPEVDFFQPYVDAVKLNPDYKPPIPPPTQLTSPADYLANAFAGYINGDEPLVLELDVVSDAVSVYGVMVSADLATLNIKAMLDNLYVEYAGDKVNIMLNNINGYIPTDKFTELMKNDEIASLLGGLGGIEIKDLQKLFGNDMLGTVFGNCEMTTEKDVTRIQMPFTLNLKELGIDTTAEIDASIYVNDEDKSLKSISGEITIGDHKITISAKPPRRAPRFPSTDGATDISGALEFIPDIITAAKQTAFGISGNLSAMGYDIAVDGYVDITDGIKVDATLSALGLDVGVKYADGRIYIALGNLDVRGTIDELPALIDAVKPYIGNIDMSEYIDIIKRVIPSTPSDFINMVKSLTVTDDTLTVKLNALAVPVTVSLSRADGKISGVDLSAKINTLGIKLDAAASLGITYPAHRDIELPSGDDYITFAQLAELINDAEPYVSASGYNINLTAALGIGGKGYELAAALDLCATNGIAACGSVSAYGYTVDVTYVGNTAYISLGNINVALDISKLDSLTGPLSRVLDIPELPTELPQINVADIPALLYMLDYVTVRDGVLVGAVTINSETLEVAIDLKNGNVTLVGSVKGITLDIAATITPIDEAPEITAPAGYVELDKLGVTIDAAIDIWLNKAFSTTVTVNALEREFVLDLAVDFANGIKLRAAESSLGLEAIVLGSDIYVSCGELRVAGSINDIPAITDALGDMIPENVKAAINGVINVAPLSTAELNITDMLATLLNAVKEITLGDTLGVTVAYDNIGIALDAATSLDSASVAVTVGNTLIKATLTDITPTATAITAPTEEFVQISALIPTIEKAVEIATAKTIAATANITLDGVALGLDVTADFANGIKLLAVERSLGIEIKLIGSNIYVAYGELRVTGSINDIPAVMDALGELIPENIKAAINGMLEIGGTKLDVLGIAKTVVAAIKSFTESDGMLYISGEYDGIGISLDVTTDLSTVAVAVDANGTGVSLKLNDIKTAQSAVQAPTEEYVQISALVPTIEKAVEIATEKAIAATANITLDGVSLGLDVTADFANGIKLLAVERSLGIEIKLIGSNIYVAYGELRVTGSINDIPAVMDALGELIPENIKAAINGMLEIGGTKLDVLGIAKTVGAAIKSFTESDGVLYISGEYDGISISLDVATDLSAVAAAVNVDGTVISAKLENITAAPVDITVTNAYARLTDIVALAAPIIPLTDARAIGLNINAELLGVSITGNIYMYFGGASTPFAIEANFVAGDVPINATIINGMLYLSVANTLRVSEELSEAALLRFADELDYAIPGFKAKVVKIIEEFKAMTLEKFLGCMALSPTDNGLSLVLDMTDIGMDVYVAFDADTTGGVWNGFTINCDISGAKFGATLDTVIEGGTLTGFTAVQTEDGLFDALDIAIARRGYHATTVDTENYIPLAHLTRLIAPLVDTVRVAKDAKSLALDISATLLTPNNTHAAISAKAVISLDPIAVDVTLTLFAETEDAVDIYVTYVNEAVYLKAGNIVLSLDTAADFERLYNVLAEYLPDYINLEIAKMLKLVDGASAFSDISLIIDRFKEIADTQETGKIVELLFKPLEGINSSSAISTVLDMINVFERDGNVAIGLSVMGITLNLTPEFDAEFTELIGASLDTNIMGYTVKFDVTSYQISNAPANVAAPANASEYVSVIEFVEAINNAVHTFTQKDADGNITFELGTFDFDYKIFAVETAIDENGNTVNVKDEAGRDKPLTDENGNKVIDKTVKVYNKPGYSALKGKFVKQETQGENGEVISSSYRFNLEAHIVLDISSLKYSAPLTLDLYIINNDEYNGLVFLDYMENNGFGERIQLDYASIMEIVAAAMEIVGVDQSTVELLIGKQYCQDIDTSVFDSMDIVGMDTIKNLLNGLADAINDGKAALGHAKSAWNLIATAGSIDGLNARLDDIKAELGKAIDKIKSAVAAFGTDDAVSEEPDEAPGDSIEMNGKLFGQIVNGVTLKKDGTHIWATIDNEITTATDGTSYVTVTQDGGKIRSIGVSGLDVNTAKLENFDAQFTAGEDVTIALPDGFNTTQGNATFSDFSDIKHILFDVMNTANMLEFDIGGLNTSDSISIKMSLGADWLANIKLNVKYNAKVKIIKVGEKPNGKPIYKTAAAIEIHNDKAQLQIIGIGSKVLVPDCTTRLFFYDDVIYIQGVSSWQNSQSRVVGTITDITCIADVWGSKQTRYPTVVSTAYKQDTSYNMNYVQVMYTVDELFYMIKNDMNRFLNEFLFYLIPLTTEKIAGQDIRGLISNSIGGSSGTTENDKLTIAQVFKGYTYNDGKHTFKLGLAELAGSSSLSDLDISLVGVNDNDDNILDNYISSLSVSTSIANIIDVSLNATLRNVVATEHGVYSKGLAPTNVTQELGKYSLNGKNYLIDCFNYDRNTVYTLDGLTYLTADGNGLYEENGSFAPALCAIDASDTFTWTSTAANENYCKSVYKFGDTGATYYYTTSLEGYGKRVEGNRDTYYIGTDANGNKYVYRMENGKQVRIAVKSITNSFLAEVARDADGNIVSVTNRNGGAVWNRIWQSAYEAAQQAA